MKSIRITDSNQAIKFACEDLKAIQSVIAMVEGEETISCERETLKVVLRALSPIIADISEAVSVIDEELSSVQQN